VVGVGILGLLHDWWPSRFARALWYLSKFMVSVVGIVSFNGHSHVIAFSLF
jgi:hypothetical protein